VRRIGPLSAGGSGHIETAKNAEELIVHDEGRTDVRMLDERLVLAGFYGGRLAVDRSSDS
jgi:hypothetical protein